MSLARDHADAFEPSASRQLISRTTVLIVGGVLVGLTLGNAVQHDMRQHAFMAGVCGIVAYLGLTCVASIRRRQATKRIRHKTISQLEARVDHHIHTFE